MTRDWFYSCLSILVLVVVAHLPPLVFGIQNDPLTLYSGLAHQGHPAAWGGDPNLDPHVGVTTQAVGPLAAWDWLHGIVPWWNPYVGIGVPLAGEMIPGAFFLPFVLLLALPGGVVWLVMAMQALGGVATLALLRTLGLGGVASLAGAGLFALNGTFSWSPGPTAVICTVPFLPLLLLGIETLFLAGERAGPTVRARVGFAWVAVAIAWSILAGFPESAYINGLLGLCWAILRFAQSARRLRFAARVLAAGMVGLMLAAPLLVGFVDDLLTQPDIFATHLGGYGALGRSSIPLVLLPGIYGAPNGGYGGDALNHLWWLVGGYGSALVLALALVQFLVRHPALGLRLMLGGWIVASLCKTFGVQPVTTIMNHVPALLEVEFYRYSDASWECAAVILAAFGIDLLRGRLPRRATWPALLVVAALLLVSALIAAPLVVAASKTPWMVASLAWAGAGLVLLWVLCRATDLAHRNLWAAGLVVGDALLMFWLPRMLGSQGAKVDLQAVRYLQRHAGLSRMYTVGPLQPNFSSYFRIASINHDILPFPAIWVHEIDTHLFPGLATHTPGANGITFWPSWPAPYDSQGALDALVAHVPDFLNLGVRYVLTAPGQMLDRSVVPPPPAGLAQPVPFGPGQAAVVTMPAPEPPTSDPGAITEVGLLVGTYGGRSDGSLRAELCDGALCGRGHVQFGDVADNAFTYVVLDQPLHPAPGHVLRIGLSHEGGTSPAALWTYPAAPPGAGDAQLATVQGAAVTPVAVRVGLRYGAPVGRRVLTSPTSTLWELEGAAPYFEVVPGEACALTDARRDGVAADCRLPATLVRRELALPGWRASVNEHETEVTTRDELFQAVALPAGRNTVRFAFAPPYSGYGWLASLMGALALAWRLVGWRRTRG